MLYDDLVQPGDYICHYGVKGMKWGVRHEENKKARVLGRAATSLRFASQLSNKTLSNAQKRYDKNPSSKNAQRLKIEKEVNKRLSKSAKTSLSELNKHYESLVNKYGQEHVKDIRYDKKGNINDYSRGQVVAGTFGAAAMAISMAMVMSMSSLTGGFGIGVSVNPFPSPRDAGSRIYRETYAQVLQEMKNGTSQNTQARNMHTQAVNLHNNMHTQAVNQHNNVNNIMNTHHMMGHF
jgi:hypothetical protein